MILIFENIATFRIYMNIIQHTFTIFNFKENTHTYIQLCMIIQWHLSYDKNEKKKKSYYAYSGEYSIFHKHNIVHHFPFVVIGKGKGLSHNRPSRWPKAVWVG